MKRASALLLFPLMAACSDGAPTAPSPASDRGSVVVHRARHEASFSYETIEVPASRSTTAFGINARGTVVGSYVDAAGRGHGFVFADGEFTTIDYPGAAYTDARGIGPAGDIVGSYRMPGEPAINFHGYRLTRHGDFVPVDYPGHTSLIAQRILPDGTILGCRHDHDFMTTMRGVYIDGDEVGETDAFASMHNGATPDRRRITGLFTNMMTGRGEGYVIEDGVFTPFIIEGSNFTAAWDMNPAGDIVGNYRDASGVHGFLLGDDGHVPLDYPGAAATRAYGLNPRGDVVGHYLAGGKLRGFIARPE